MGIRPGDFVSVDEARARAMSFKAGSAMGKSFVVVPEGVDPMKTVQPPEKKWQKKR